MNAITPIAKASRRTKLTLKPPADNSPVVGSLIPSAPAPIALRLLRRAPENVRHVRIDEDVTGLADDIAAHGLLANLIGYAGSWPEDDGKVFVVGGGRRLQALQLLLEQGVVDGDYAVPVLVRGIDDAIELSLAENLQQRSMSPVDEFLAFRALMDRGTNSPEGLAKRFGFSERVVKQRLRLAELASPILDALAGREITLDAAMAYASSQDQDLQAEVFKAQAKRSWEPHAPRNIRQDLSTKGVKTDSPLFKFVGAEAYERRGGSYEDDLFNEGDAARILAHPILLQEIARELIPAAYGALLPELVCSLAPTITGFVPTADLRLHSYGNSEKVSAPAGFAKVDTYESSTMWKAIKQSAIPAQVLVGIDQNGKLAVWERTVFVPKAERQAAEPPKPNYGYTSQTPEERAAEERKRGIERWSRRLAIGTFAGTPLEGRAFWPELYEDRSKPTTIDGVAGHLVTVQVFVTNAAIAEQVVPAEARYDQALAERAAAEEAMEAARVKGQERSTKLAELEPPAVVVVDGQAWGRGEDGSYATIDEEGDPGFAQSWAALLANYGADDIGETFASRVDFDTAMGAALDTDGAAA